MFKKLLRESGIYAIGDVINRGLTFFLVPLYTAYMLPSDYGILGISNIIMSIYPIFAAMGIQGAALKFYYDYDNDEDRKDFYGTVVIFSIISSGLMFLVLELMRNSLFPHLFKNVPFSPYIHLSLVGGLLTTVFLNIPRQHFRASSNAAAYSLANIVLTVTTLGFTIWWVVVARRGAEGALLGKLAGLICTSVVIVIYFVRFMRITFNLKALKAALAYSIPMMPHYLSSFLIIAASRVVMERYVSLSDLGLFNLAFNIGMTLYLFIIGLNNAIVPYFGKLDLSDENSITEVTKATGFYLTIFSLIAFFAMIFAPEAIIILTPDTYLGAIPYVTPVLVGFVFFALYAPFSNIITLVSGNSKQLALSTTTAAGLGIFLNIVLIPKFLLTGAVIAHITTYIILATMTWLLARRTFKLHYSKTNIYVLFAGTLLIVISNHLLLGTPIIIVLVIKLLIFTLLFAVLWAFRRDIFRGHIVG